LNGGGLNNDATATLTHVTFSGNSAFNGGGGGLNNNGTASLTNVTFSGNTAAQFGGGLNNLNATATLTHVTFNGNTAGLSGGGIYRTAGTVLARASIVANSPSGGNCGGTITNQGFNLSTDASCSGFNQVANVMLGPLANNGGFTQTHLPQPGSPAIDLVATGCPPPATDQRGANRPVDGDGLGGAACDAGAVEYGAITSVVYLPLVRK
ncbi:MAG: choice-of-anchor Q domain-containing protein, partial [Anaerolineae bacterium]